MGLKRHALWRMTSPATTARLILLVLSGLAFRPPPAAAQQIGFEGQTAWNAPLGSYGLAVDADLPAFVRFAGGSAALTTGASAGIGMQTFNQIEVGPRWAFMPRLRLSLGGQRRFTVSIGAGMSSGRSEAYPGGATRADGELSLEHRWHGGLKLRVFGGLASVLAHAGGQALPFHASYVGLALGYSFQQGPPPAPSWSIAGWYGWQSLALDALALAIPPATNQLHEDDWMFGLGHSHIATRAMIGVFVISGPSVHAAHRRWSRAALSAAARLLIPLAFGAAGHTVLTGDGGGDLTEPAALAGGVLVGVADAVLLGWDGTRPF